MVSQIIGISTVCSTIGSGIRQRKHQNSVLLVLCEGNPPVTSGFPSQRASNMENVPCHVIIIDPNIWHVCLDDKVLLHEIQQYGANNLAKMSVQSTYHIGRLSVDSGINWLMTWTCASNVLWPELAVISINQDFSLVGILYNYIPNEFLSQVRCFQSRKCLWYYLQGHCQLARMSLYC